MRLMIWTCAVAVLAAASLTEKLPAADPPPGGIKWQTDLNVAHLISRQTNKPMLFVFGADWCTWCKKLEKTTLTNRELVAFINANYVPIHIDADRDPRVVEILEAESPACAVILSPNADLLGRIRGYKDAKNYQAALAGALAPAGTVTPRCLRALRSPVTRSAKHNSIS